jgi:hypothetical protein
VKTFTPEAEIGFGVLAFIVIAASVYDDFSRPPNPGLRALNLFGWPCGMILGLLMIWRGWKRKKQPPPTQP